MKVLKKIDLLSPRETKEKPPSPKLFCREGSEHQAENAYQACVTYRAAMLRTYNGCCEKTYHQHAKTKFLNGVEKRFQ